MYMLVIPMLIGKQSLLAQRGYADSLQNVIQKDNDPSERMHAMVLLADAIMPRELDSAGKLIAYATTLSTSPNDQARADYHNVLAVYQWYRGNHDSAIQALIPVTRMKESPEMLPKLARAFNNIGTLYGRKQIPDSAHKYLHESLRIDMGLGNDYGVSKTYYDLSVMYFRKGHLELSLRYQLLSIPLIEAQNDTMRLINALNVLGNIYADLKEPDKAFEAYSRAIELDAAYEGLNSIAMMYSNISSIFTDTPETFEKALTYAQKGIENLTNEKRDELMPYLQTNIGGAYLSINQPHKALPYFHYALSYFDPDIPHRETGAILLNISKSHRMLENWDSARHYAKLSSNHFEKTKSLSKLSSAYFTLASADSAQGRFEQAHENYIQAVALRDSTWSIENRNRISELQIIYDTDKKEAENKLLAEQNKLSRKVIRNQKLLIIFIITAAILVVSLLILEHRMKRKMLRKNKEILRQKEELHEQSIRLAELNATKDKFFSIIAHDLRGPFSSLAGLLEILIDEYETMNDSDRRQVLEVLKQNSANTLNLLLNLLDWARAQTGIIENKPETINMHEKINQVFGILNGRAGEKNHQLLNEVPENSMVFADPQLVQSILINLLNNAIKFSPTNSKTKVTASKINGYWRICVEDNGIGIPDEKLGSLFKLDSKFKRPGTNMESGTGLGLIMVHEFLQLAGGTITVESHEGNGSRFCFTLPSARS